MAMGTQIYELSNNTIHLETIENMKSFCPLYLEGLDTLIFQPKNPVPAISVDWNGDIMLRIDPKTREIVGIEIEDFEGYFVTKYPEFAPIWKQVKKAVKKNQCENEELTAFLTIVQDLLHDLVSKQGSINIMPPSITGQGSLI